MTDTIRAADALARRLYDAGCRYAFGMPGGEVLTVVDALRAAGVVEFGGLDGPENPAPTRMIEKAVKRVYPGLSYDSLTTWMGRRPTTPDSLPVIGQSPKAPNVFHAYGGQHVGLTIGPKIGRLIADLAGGRSPNIDLSAYDPDRF